MSVLCFSDVACIIVVTMPRLSNNQRLSCIGILEAGILQKDVACIMGSQKITDLKLPRRYLETGSVADRPRSGHPKVTTERQDRYVQITHL